MLGEMVLFTITGFHQRGYPSSELLFVPVAILAATLAQKLRGLAMDTLKAETLAMVGRGNDGSATDIQRRSSSVKDSLGRNMLADSRQAAGILVKQRDCGNWRSWETAELSQWGASCIEAHKDFQVIAVVNISPVQHVVMSIECWVPVRYIETRYTVLGKS
jgi:hypothetical protein